MPYRPPEHLLWDFWFAPKRPGEPYTLFHLEAPATLPDPEGRHVVAEIGQAVSDDLVRWRRTGTVLGQGQPGSWDDRAIWTGCCVRHGETAYLFYTALSTTDLGPGLVQRIGVATSTDLRSWRRHPGNPILTADPRWYETAADHPRGDEACRDPFVLWDAARGEWLMVYCARAKDGPLDARGTVGAARSSDLLTWEPLPPLDVPREFGQLEVPQIVPLAGRWYLVFCTFDHAATRLAQTGSRGAWAGTHYFVADALRGPYRLLEDGPLDADPRVVWYAGRIETELTSEPLFFAWQREDGEGRFVGGLSGPAPVRVEPDGRLRVEMADLWPG